MDGPSKSTAKGEDPGRDPKSAQGGTKPKSAGKAAPTPAAVPGVRDTKRLPQKTRSHGVLPPPRRPLKTSGGLVSLRPVRSVSKIVDHAQDDILAVKLVDDLEFRHGVDVSTIDITVRDGRSTVRGTVSDSDELDSIKDTIRDEQGITDIDCGVVIAPTRREEDRDQARIVQESIDADPELSRHEVHVAAMSQIVILRGKVSHALAKAKAGLLALRQPGILRVRNRLVVVEATRSTAGRGASPPSSRPAR